MIKKSFLYILYTIVLGVTLLIGWRTLNSSQQVQMTVEDLFYFGNVERPLSYPVGGGEYDGISIAVLKLVLQELGVKKAPDITLQPWATVYKKTQAQPGAVLMSIFRDESHEHLFKWACSIFNEQVAAIGLKESKIVEENFDRYTYGVLLSTIANKYISAKKNLAVEQILRVNSMPLLVKMLAEKRVDLVVGAKQSLFTEWKRAGYQAEIDVYQVVYEVPMCFAMNKETPDHIVEQFVSALKKVMASQAYMELHRKFLL